MRQMKKLMALLLAAWMLVSVSACGGSPAVPEDTEPPDLTGVWRQVDSQDEDFYQQAQIEGDVIEIYWVDTAQGTETASCTGPAPLLRRRPGTRPIPGSPSGTKRRPTWLFWPPLTTPRPSLTQKTS